ncbi:MAG: hypothetical protein OXG79_09350 [Chloroflexi bacterium]|nr:hypothetical protein [Chloroflexota bacterium]
MTSHKTRKAEPRASASFTRELEAFVRDWEEHLVRVGYAPRTVKTHVRGPSVMLRWLRGEVIAPGQTGR